MALYTKEACRFFKTFPQRLLLFHDKNIATDMKSKSKLNSEVTLLTLDEMEEIKPPWRIHRNPTDILKALSSTVRKDYTAAHYKYHDDPYFIPASNVDKRHFSLSKESGRKAAQYFLENYPLNFKNDPAEPTIKAFNPPLRYTEENKLSEDILKECVVSCDVNNAKTVYEALIKKGVNISQETSQLLLELLCFSNSDELLTEEFVEEKWYRKHGEKDKRMTWKEKGSAEKVFNRMEKDSKAYCAMIQGTAKFLNVDQSYALFEEMQGKNLKANVETYNAVLSIVPYLKESGENRWKLAEELLRNMNSLGIYPNLKTMTSLLEINSKYNTWHGTKYISLKIIAEMKRLKIEPSLAAYYYLLIIFCKDRKLRSPILLDIIKEIEGKELTIKHPKDVFFFVTAMDVCHNYLGQIHLAYRINSMLEQGNNFILIGDSLKESIYYQHFFKLLCVTENIEKFMDIYDKYVPQVYTPEPSVMLEIIQAIDLNGAYEYLPKLWTDIITFGHIERENIVNELLQIIGRYKHDAKLQKTFVDIAWNIKERLDTQPEGRTKNIQWSGQMLGNVLNTCLNGKELKKSWEIMHKLIHDDQNVIGCPGVDCLKKFCSVFLDAKALDKVMLCLKYATEAGYLEVVNYVKNNAVKYDLDAEYRSHIDASLKYFIENENFERSITE